jgi:hypothetical protein
MRFLKSLLILVVLCAGCSDAAINMQTTGTDTAMRSIDSSEIINNTTRLPQDSTTITVTH